MAKFKREVEIDAPVEKVWQVISDPNHFTEWLPGVDSVSNVVTSERGTNFDWAGKEKSGTGTVTNIDPLKRLEIVTQSGEDKDSHQLKLRPSGKFLGLGEDECQVEYTMDTLSGSGILGRFIESGNPRDTLQVKKATHRLRKLVERI